MNWTKKKIEDITEVITKGTTPTTIGFSFTDEGINFVKIECITDDGNFLLKKMEHIPEECNEKMKRSQLKENDILFSIAGAIGRTAIVPKTILPANTNQALAIIRLNTNQVLPEFLVMCLKSEQVLKQFEKKKQGVAQLNLSLKDIAELEVAYPDILEQKRVLSVLKKAQELVDKRKKQIQACDELIKSQFIEMFGDICKNEKMWKMKTINEMCHSILGGGTPSKSHPEYYIGNIPWVTPKDMKQLRINNSIDHITDEAIQNSSAKLIPTNSMLMVIRSGILKRTLPVSINDVEVAVNQDMKAFIPNENTNSDFLLYTFKMRESELLGNVRGVTADNIEFSIIKNLVTPCPPIELQNRFSQFVQQVDKLKFEMEKSLHELENNFNALMQKAFSGQLF